MYLILLLKRQTWFIEQDSAWFALADSDQINIALYALPLKVVNDYEQIEQAHIAGEASLEASSDDHCVRLLLIEPDGTQVSESTLSVDGDSLVSIRWLEGCFKDGWIGASARLRFEGVRQVELQAYLPARDAMTVKALQVTDEESGEVTEICLDRDGSSRVELRASSTDRPTILRLEMAPETLSDSRDPRELGFVLVAETYQVA